MKSGIILFFGAFASCFALLAGADEDLSIFQIFDQFHMASYAASKCVKPDEKVLEKFQSNYVVVGIRAAEALEKRSPGASKQVIANSVKRRAEFLDEKVGEIVTSGGCEDPRIQDLIKRFYVQANLEFAK